MLQTSSPSVLLTASLDAARAMMVAHGCELLGHAVNLAEQARVEIGAQSGLTCFGRELLSHTGVASFDPTKLIVRVADLGWTGFGAARWLARHRGVEVEFAEFYNVVCSITFADTIDSVNRLVSAFEALSHARPPAKPSRFPLVPIMSRPPEQAINFLEALSLPNVSVSTQQAVSRVAAEMVMPYPPGVPVLLPGEVVDQSSVDYLQNLIEDGATIVGPDDVRLRTIRVVA